MEGFSKIGHLNHDAPPLYLVEIRWLSRQHPIGRAHEEGRAHGIHKNGCCALIGMLNRHVDFPLKKHYQ
ncbi:protein of unknown function [Acidithiobacillus ferrivorans]|uniref:Transposase n=1 Tax=Acidithiobacillus ferrivorans TaxID=160808 RepID=A0ABY1MRL7_9PROT|nr:protein of unknown function [Acidithiobacillus ferrivorans]